MRLVSGVVCVLFLAALSTLPAFSQAKLELNPQDKAVLQSDPLGAMQSARERVAAGDLEGAIRTLATYVSGHPGEIGPERLLGDLYFRHGDVSKAEAQYQHILQYAPGDKETHNRLGSVYATENRIDDAITEYNRSLPGSDSVPSLVRLHVRKGDIGAYIMEKERNAKANPTDPEPQIELGEAYEGTHRPADALLYFRRALDQDPYNWKALNWSGVAYMDLRDYADALRVLGTCLARDHYNYPCANNMGAAYLEDKDFAKASPILNTAHSMMPEQGEALINLGYLQDMYGNWKEAIVYYVRAITVYPYAPEAYINLGADYNSHGQFKLAQQALAKGIAVAPDDGRLHFLLGQAYAEQGLSDLAAQQYKLAAISDDPQAKALAQQAVAALSSRPKNK